MQYTPHYNLNLPEGTDIVNPLIQDNPNYSAIDTALYDNKLRVIGTATHTKTGTNHSIVLADSDIPVFRFVATGDYTTGDTFSVDGVTVTARVADGSSVPTGAFKINSTVIAILDGTLLNLINVSGTIDPDDIILPNGSSVEDELTTTDLSITAINGSIQAGGVKRKGDLIIINLRYIATVASAAGDVIVSLPYSVASSVAHVSLANNMNYNIDVLTDRIRTNSVINAGDVIEISGCLIIEP